MTNNRKIEERDKLNPEVALIRKTSSTNTEAGWRYIKLLIQNCQINNPKLEEWLNIKYHNLEEMQFLEVKDTRPIAGALFYIGSIRTQENPNKKLIRKILKPLSQNTLDKKIKNMQRLLDV